MNASVSPSCRLLVALAVVLTLPAVAQARGSDPTVVRHELLGRSARGREIHVIEVGDPDERRKVLVVGCIHGDEPAGIGIADAVASLPPLAAADVWVVPSLNPDGVAAHTRQNGRGVDLNRNFPWHWRPLGGPGSRYYAGPHALSEPESRLAASLILRLRPSLSIWFHQPYGVMDESGGDVRIERRFADLVGLPLQRLARYPGSVASWENHTLPGSTAFVVELHGGALSAGEVTRFANAVRTVAAR